MRLFLTALLGGLLSFGCGLALVFAATEWLPCLDDAGSCRMGEAFGYLGAIIYAPLATAVFGLTAWRSASERPIAIAALVLLAPIAAILLMAVVRNGLPVNFAHERQGLLQFYAPPALIVAVQWAVLRAYISRSAPAQ
jgi:hypothetical protein